MLRRRKKKDVRLGPGKKVFTVGILGDCKN
jgi:hypothetical protein